MVHDIKSLDSYVQRGPSRIDRIRFRVRDLIDHGARFWSGHNYNQNFIATMKYKLDTNSLDKLTDNQEKYAYSLWRDLNEAGIVQLPKGMV